MSRHLQVKAKIRMIHRVTKGWLFVQLLLFVFSFLTISTSYGQSRGSVVPNFFPIPWSISSTAKDLFLSGSFPDFPFLYNPGLAPNSLYPASVFPSRSAYVNLIPSPSNPSAQYYYPITRQAALFNPLATLLNGLSLPTLPSLAFLNSPWWGGVRAEIVLPALDAIPNYTYTIVNVFPHDKTAFTQGLDYDNGFLYEGTGIPGLSSLRKVDLITGTVLQLAELAPPYFGEGITVVGNQIVQLTWLHKIGFVYDKFTFELLDEFYYPTQGWGITRGAGNLIMSDGTATLHFLDPLTFEEVGQVEVFDQNGPVTRLNELEYIQGEVYANVWLTDKIARIDPVSGQVVGWIDLSGLLSPEDIVFPIDVLNGIAYDPKLDRLFVTGKFWPKLFEIDLVLLP